MWHTLREHHLLYAQDRVERVRSTAGLDLLKWGFPWGGVKNLLKPRRPPMSRTPGVAVTANAEPEENSRGLDFSLFLLKAYFLEYRTKLLSVFHLYYPLFSHNFQSESVSIYIFSFIELQRPKRTGWYGAGLQGCSNRETISRFSTLDLLLSPSSRSRARSS